MAICINDYMYTKPCVHVIYRSHGSMSSNKEAYMSKQIAMTVSESS